MCWSEPVSWATFAIGTLFNLFLIKQIPNPLIYAISFIWEWVLFMQLFEAFIWRDPEMWQNE